MASETPNNGRNRRRKDSWWDGQCTALALILAALLLVLCGILLKQGRMPWQQGEKTEAEAVSESGGAAEIPGGSMEASSGAESAGVPGGAEGLPAEGSTEGGTGESSSGAEESSAEESSTGESSTEESSSAEESSTAESSAEAETAESSTAAEETKPARKVSDYGPGSRVDSEALEELGTSAFFTQSEISGSVKDRIYGKSYRENPHISMSDLRYIRVLYYDYSGNRRVGELVSNKAISGDLVEIFRDLYDAKYPIDKMKLVDDYDASDDWSSSENNTSCFNYRTVAGSNSLSLHARGLAIDINPRDNPMVYYDENGNVAQCLPANGEAYADRSKDFSHKIDQNDLCYQLFMEHGFTWGGNWNAPDYMHFSKSATPEGG